MSTPCTAIGFVRGVFVKCTRRNCDGNHRGRTMGPVRGALIPFEGDVSGLEREYRKAALGARNALVAHGANHPTTTAAVKAADAVRARLALSNP